MPDALSSQDLDLWALGGRWLRRAHAIIADSADALNAMNVFPVSDSDTGANLALTLAGIEQVVPARGRAEVNAVVQAAILSAHGNSGAILAEMITSVCRALAYVAPAATVPAGVAVATLLETVSDAATQAVARPVAGTILTVAEAAATGAAAAAAEHPHDPLAVASAARVAAADGLARTPDLLEVLAEAGVVDAGGQAYVLLLDVLVEVLGGPPARALPGSAAAGPSRPPVVAAQPEYEVMYALRGARVDRLSALRQELSELGHSVVVVGDQSVAQVHVHLVEAGAAVEAGIAAGALSQLRITALPTLRRAERTVVAVVAGPGLAEAVQSLGALAVRPAGSHATVAELTAALETTAGDVVLLPNDMETLEMAGHLARQLRGPDRRIAVIPTTAQIQGLAAVAVHEPTADFDSAVVAMSSTAGHARHGAVTVAESPAMTMAGRCERGDVLGLVDGDFVEIGDDLADVAWRVVNRLLSSGGELLTLVHGVGARPELVADLSSRARRAGVEVDLVEGGQSRYPLLLGIE